MAGVRGGARDRALAVAIGLSVAGCSTSDQPQLGTVHGKVTLDGQPLAGAIVVFSPVAEGRQSFAETNAEGEYELIDLRDTRGAIVGGIRSGSRRPMKSCRTNVCPPDTIRRQP